MGKTKRYDEPPRRTALRADVNQTLQQFGFVEVSRETMRFDARGIRGNWFRLYRGRFTHDGAERLLWVSDAGPVIVCWSSVPKNYDVAIKHLTPADAPHRMTATTALLRFGPPYELKLRSEMSCHD